MLAEFPNDHRCYAECGDMVLDTSLPVVPTVDEGQTHRSIYLPTGAHQVSYWSGEAFEGERTTMLPSPWDQPVILIHEGDVITLNVTEQHFDRRVDQRGFLVAPMQGVGEFASGYVGDDGETEAWRRGEQGRWSVRAVSGAQAITLHVSHEGKMPAPADMVEIHLPAGDARSVQTPHARVPETVVAGGWRRLTSQLPAQCRISAAHRDRVRRGMVIRNVPLAQEVSEITTMKATRAKRAISIRPVYVSVALFYAGTSMQAAAQTSATLYGVVDSAFTYSSNQGDHSNTYIDSDALLTSRSSLYGTGDLSSGSTAPFRLESGLNAVTGQQSQARIILNRRTYVGLSSTNYDQVTLSRAYTPYLQCVASLGPTNVLTSTTGVHPGDVDTLDTTLRFNNSVAYTTSVLDGLQADIQYGFGEQAGGISSDGSVNTGLCHGFQAFSWSVGYIRLKNVPIGTTTGNFSNVGTFTSNPPVNASYTTADSAQLIATTTRYTFGRSMVGLDCSNVQYKPGALSLFTQSATFNTVDAIATYDLMPALRLAFGYSYTAEKAHNGISSPAKHSQFSVEQLYSLSKRTTFYAIQAYQRVNGQTLHTSGTSTSIMDVVASVDDSQNGTPSNGRGQFIGMVGIRHSF